MGDWAEDRANSVPAGVLKSDPDPPDFPREWSADQRMTAYWFVVQHHGRFPTHQSGWYAMLSQAQHTDDHVKDVLTEVVSDLQEGDKDVDRRMPYKDD